MKEKEDHIHKNETFTESESEVKVKTELKPDDWLCIACNKKITSDEERFEYNNQSEFQFINPSGFYFNIITFLKADGCRDVGEATMEFTGEISNASELLNAVEITAADQIDVDSTPNNGYANSQTAAEDDYAILVFEDSQQFKVPVDKLPAGYKDGSVLYVTFYSDKDGENNREKIAKQILNDILKDSE